MIVGDSIAGCTAARELRSRGHTGPITMIGADRDGSYARPPLSKQCLREGDVDTHSWDLADLTIAKIAQRATGLDVEEQVVDIDDGTTVPYDALVVATGAGARSIARDGQRGEMVLRTAADARSLRASLNTAHTVIVVGAGFLGMEIASACSARGIGVTVVDVEAPLERLLGSHLSRCLSARARACGVNIQLADEHVRLVGDPVEGIHIDGTTLRADVVITCAGDEPATRWLGRSGIADDRGIGVDERCATAAPNVYAAGDVTYRRGRNTRMPYWSNAVAQGKVAAASILGVEPACAPTDDYFWTEVLGLSIKVVGPLGMCGQPTTLEGSVDDGEALLEWRHDDGRRTIVAYGMRKSVATLRRMV